MKRIIPPWLCSGTLDWLADAAELDAAGARRRGFAAAAARMHAEAARLRGYKTRAERKRRTGMDT